MHEITPRLILGCEILAEKFSEEPNPGMETRLRQNTNTWAARIKVPNDCRQTYREILRKTQPEIMERPTEKQHRYTSACATNWGGLRTFAACINSRAGTVS
jgi:hypothetical protein